MVPILKPNKNNSLPVSYKPISFLTSLSKVAERVIKNRLDSFLKENNILTDEQFGFRRKYSTVDQLNRYINDITGAIFFDLEKPLIMFGIMALFINLLSSKYSSILSY